MGEVGQKSHREPRGYEEPYSRRFGLVFSLLFFSEGKRA